MTPYCFESPYGIDVTELNVTRYPVTATLVFNHDGVVYRFRCVNPRPLSAITEAFGECYQIRVVDLNDGGAQLDFGRYKIELWDEDNPYTEISADYFAQSPIGATTDG